MRKNTVMRKFIYVLAPFMCASFLSGCNEKSYTVTWKNYDGSILEVDTNVREGSKPTYNGQTPAKGGNEFCNYSFAGWDKNLEEVHSDQIYFATFNTDANPTTTTVFELYMKNSFEFKFDSITSAEGTNLSIDWGDGTVNNETSHLYENPGNFVMMVANMANVKCDSNPSITSISFGNTISKIVNSAFWSCSNITSVKFSDNLTTIEAGAFYNCTSLSNLEFSSNLTTIGSSSFYYCTSLKKLFIPALVETIGSLAFTGCSNLEEIKVDPSNEHFDSRDNCNCLINTNKQTLILGCNKSFIPNGVSTIGISSFINCYYLESIDIPETVTRIEDDAFHRCIRLKSVTIPSSVTFLGYSVFFGCATLENVEILSNYVKTIPFKCFYRCFKLKNINIPTSVTKIGSNSFCQCTTLKSIFIPKEVTVVEDDVFFGCTSLTIYCERTEAPSTWNERWNSTKCPVVWEYTPE